MAKCVKTHDACTSHSTLQQLSCIVSRYVLDRARKSKLSLSLFLLPPGLFYIVEHVQKKHIIVESCQFNDDDYILLHKTNLIEKNV